MKTAAQNKPLFEGFSPKAFTFLEALTDNQNRLWFNEHRSEYEDYVRDPLREFTVTLSDFLRTKDIPLWGDPKRSLFRINRDARFSKAKHPYNMHASGLFSITGDKHAPGVLYFRLDPLGSRVAAGYMQPEPHVLKKLRMGILDNPKAWLLLEKSLHKKGYVLDYSDALARVPRGFIDAPIEIEHALKLKSWIIRKPLSKKVVCSTELIQEVAIFAKDLLPLLSFGWHSISKFSE
ncbi:DUF2461 domain-containing protein [Polynucleobacter brandtiae]|uniref:Uncharacterized protein (TIGR02453 family) n=1 Tax=Polynucleobacter brandtiae TaxID=1938816 RepID=A0A2M8VZP9_9BURK|nr:DUF2461 domain-containing protein [Polynucleobacter brandtiae]PJI83330.1 uncharacterized protein (TIGR02453 family) [Polynucleobacter brandtiae]